MKTTTYRVEKRVKKLDDLPGYWKLVGRCQTEPCARLKANRAAIKGARIRIIKVTTEEVPR